MGLDDNEKVFSVHGFGMLVVGAGSLWSNFGTNGFGHFLHMYIYIYRKFLRVPQETSWLGECNHIGNNIFKDRMYSLQWKIPTEDKTLETL